MADLKSFDPTRVLDGWRAPAPPAIDLALPLEALRPAVPADAGFQAALDQVRPERPVAVDAAHVLDGWRAPAPEPLDLDIKSVRRGGSTRPDNAKKAWLKARGYEMLDVEDVEVSEKPSAPGRFELPELVIPEAPEAPDDGPLPPTAEAEVLAEADEPRIAALEPLPTDELTPTMAEIASPELPVSPASGEAAAAPSDELAHAVEHAAPIGAVEVEADAPPIAALEPLPSVDEAPAPDVDPPPPPAPAMDPPVLDFHASPPLPEPDPQRVLDDIRLPQVAPPPMAVEAPELDFHLPAAPVEPDPQRLIDDIALPKVAPPMVAETPVLDLPVATSRAARDPRLLERWQPLAWTALARRVTDAATEVVQTPRGPRVETHPPQWLCALWRPQSVDTPLLGRWPELAGLVGADTVLDALQQLLAALPPRAHLWQAELDADWALVAELVLQQDDDLSAAHANSLRELVEAQRSASEALVSGGYAAKGRVVRRRT